MTNTIVRLNPNHTSINGQYSHGEHILILCDTSRAAFTTSAPSASSAEDTELIFQNTAPSGGNALTIGLSSVKDTFDNAGAKTLTLAAGGSITMRSDMVNTWWTTANHP